MQVEMFVEQGELHFGITALAVIVVEELAVLFVVNDGVVSVVSLLAIEKLTAR